MYTENFYQYNISQPIGSKEKNNQFVINKDKKHLECGILHVNVLGFLLPTFMAVANSNEFSIKCRRTLKSR
jgi:hypothetical protein